MDIRKGALVACVAVVLSVLPPMWGTIESTAALESRYPQWWMIPLLAIEVLFTAILPVFYFALYRNEGSLRFSRRLRLLALTAVLVLAVNVAIDLPGRIGSLGHQGDSSVLIPERWLWTLSDVSWALGALSGVACILLMIAFWRNVSDESDAAAPVSRLLRAMTRVAVISWGIWVALLCLRLAVAPYSYAHFRVLALQYGRTPPPVRYFMVEPARAALSAAALFAGPYIVWRAIMPPKGGMPSN